MKIKRFFAKDMKTALAQVKDTLGADAVIMSNKKVTGGIEIVAAIDNEPPQPETRRNELKEKLADELRQVKRKLADDKVQIGRPAPAQQAHPEKRERGTFSNLLKRYVNQDGSLDEAETEADSLSALLQRQANRGNGGGHRQESRDNGYGMPRNRYMEEQPARNRRRDDDDPNPFNRLSQKNGSANGNRALGPGPKRAQEHSLFSRNGQDSHDRQSPRLDPTRYDKNSHQQSPSEIDAMRREMASIRSLLEHQLSGLMWQEVERREPLRAMLIKRLEKLGLSSEFADQLAGYIPESTPANEAWTDLMDLLADQVITVRGNLLEAGGVIALLGPTGVGKTTTIAKLAAQAAMEFGPEEIALVTTDTYRIGAHEQLATYGRILGCPVRVAKDADDLADILYQLRHRRLVLLDTAGMGQRDIRLSEQLDTLMQNSGADIKSLLVMPATAQRRVLQETLEHFRRIPLSGCVLTKLDESLSLGEVLCVTLENALPVAYLADGQRVPEDIRPASGKYLVRRACELMETNEEQQPHFWSNDSLESNAADYYD